MNSRPRFHWAIPVLAAVGLGFVVTASATNRLPPITLKAGLVSTTLIGQTRLGAPIEILYLSRNVNYADLDLATPAGFAALVQRVRQTAAAACQRLNPQWQAQTHSCARNATALAMRQVRRAVAAAKARHAPTKTATRVRQN